MLVLTRKLDESIIIDGRIEVVITDIGSNKVRLGVHAPSDVTVHRKEVFDAIEQKKQKKAPRVAKATPAPARSRWESFLKGGSKKSNTIR